MAFTGNFILSGAISGGLAALLAFGPACAQGSAPAPASAQAAAPATGAEKSEAPDNLRIRGLIERVDESGAVVQLSQGISIRVDLPEGASVMNATRITIDEMKPGSEVRVRTRSGASAPAGAPGTTIAGDVLVMSLESGRAESIDAAELSTRGVVKGVERTAEGATLVITDKGTDRRLQVTTETTFWRLQGASLRDLKPGLLLSVLIVRTPEGSARTERAVFGSVPAGTLLPL